MPTKHPYESFYIPFLFLVAATLVGIALPVFHIEISSAQATALNVLAGCFLVAALLLAYRAQAKNRAGLTGRGGRGGDATSIGDANKVTGGRGGAANGGTGGAGGDATARGNRSVVKGGNGGVG